MPFEQETQQLPNLIPIRKKRQFQASTISQPDQTSNLQPTQKKNQNREENNGESKKFQEPTKAKDEKPASREQPSKQQKESDVKKIESFSEKFMNIQQTSANNKKTNKKSEQQKKQENEKFKFLVAEMLNKISVKNISEELYPITNETIERVLLEMEEEIKFLKAQAQNKQNSLQMNPENKDLILQLGNLKKSIDHCVTIKELYNEKINFRNKIAILEGKIIELKAENRGLKITVSKGIDKIENHMQNLPSQKQKELREELNKITEDRNKEKEMRLSLQNNIQDIIMNFKRLYEEADTARMIVTKKLKEVEERQKKLNEARNENYFDINDEQTSNSIKKSPKLQMLDDKKTPKITASNHNNAGNNESEKSVTQRYRHNNKSAYERPERDKSGTVLKTMDTKEQRKPMSFEESLKKMRGNQQMFSKMYQQNGGLSSSRN